MKSGLLFTVALCALLAGCFKDVSYKTNYILKPLQRETAGGPIVPLTEFKAFAYGVDTTNWTVASYEDALDGIITSKENPAEKISVPIATAEPYEAEGSNGWFRLSIAKSSQMVLAIDMQDSIYAYTQQALGENLPYLYVSLVFQKWKTGLSYKDGKWSYYNPNYKAPVYVNFYVDAKAQAEEDGETEEIKSLKIYAFEVDSSAYYVASYEDAVGGMLTQKSDTTQKFNNSIAGTAEENGLYRLSIGKSPIMIVVADRTDQRYAYIQQNVVIDPDADPVTLPVTFRLWKQQYIYVEEGWRVVDPALKPVEPDSPLIPSNRKKR